MKTLQIFDPAMCCSTGVCGPSVDQRLLKLAADCAFLKSKGISVERFNLAHQPEAFTANPVVLEAMGAEAENLPIFLVDGEIRATATYPNRQELASWFGLEAGASPERNLPTLKMTATSSPDDKACC
jgi:Arsenical resistance operon protein ArsD